MKPNEIRALVKTFNPMFKNTLTFVNEKNDGSFGVKIKGFARILNVERTHTGAFIIKFYPFLDMVGSHNWAVRDAAYATYRTTTVDRIMRSKYFGKQADYFMKKYKLNHRNEDTTMGAFLLDDMTPGEMGALIVMTIIAHGEQLAVRQHMLECLKAER